MASVYNPLCIDSLHLPSDGRIGMTACPGRWRLFGSVGIDGNGLERDLSTIRDWGATALVSLVEQDELEFLGIPLIGERARRIALDWYHLPIPDFRAPGADFEQGWGKYGQSILSRLRKGERIVIHCLAGLGRTGTVAARILVELGHDPGAAIRRVRETRPGAIQNPEQERYILERHWLGCDPRQSRPRPPPAEA